jgi:nucleotide-binding universal stress UspA family protein
MRIMLATDGSKAAQAATAYLKELPLPPSTTLRITAVVTLPALAIEAASVRDFERAALDEARRLVEATRATLAPRGYPIETDVAVGDPRVEIVRQAEEWGADLIVLGARGLGMFKRLLLGSVSLAIARQARCSVLVVKGRPRKFGSVLVAMDGSEESFQAVRFLHSLALPRQSKVRLLSVVERLRYPTTAPGALRGQLLQMLKELEAERRGELDKVLERAAAQFDDKITRVTRYTPTGNPADEILTTANAFDTGLVVVGARGLGGAARLLLGSVSEKVLCHARCPVLIARERSKA